MEKILPVMVEDLIKKVTDQNLHTEQRQHYVSTLKNIRDAADEALTKYNIDKTMNRKFRK
tara:strand:- start:4682 stop:4861 length:180 start_codon:yes stop_codon:yes gene_type:complete